MRASKLSLRVVRENGIPGVKGIPFFNLYPFRESVMRTPTVDLSGLARTTNVSTLVPSRVDKELTVPCRTM